MIQFAPSLECEPLKGLCVYRAYEYSFDFLPDDREEVIRLAGESATTSILIGTLQLEVGITTGVLLYAWGYHPHTQWRRDRLPRISSQKGCVKVLFDEEPVVGVSQGLAEVGEWQTTHDEDTGWICLNANEHDVAESYVEFAANTIGGLADQKLVSLWLRPIWHRERFEEGPVSLFSELTT